MGRPKLRWEDIVKRDIEDLGGGANWKDLTMNRDGWRIGCERPINPRRRVILYNAYYVYLYPNILRLD